MLKILSLIIQIFATINLISYFVFAIMFLVRLSKPYNKLDKVSNKGMLITLLLFILSLVLELITQLM